jgi:hypothetical protein
MYFLIIPLGFLLAMRGARPAPLQRPGEGLRRIWREAADLFLTTGLILALWGTALAFDGTRLFAQDYAILGFGIAAFLLSRSQKKTDVFFLAAAALVFWVSARQAGLFHGLFLAAVACAGIAVFQTCFLGLRYRLLFSNVPASMKGWPVLCLLAGLIALVLRGLGRLVF